MAAGRRGTTPSAAETPQFKQLVDRCLREDPEDRWQSASDLANIIEWSRAQSDTSPATSARSKPNANTWKTSLIAGAGGGQNQQFRLILHLAVNRT
jgi:serine/threonine protein kinase